MENHVDLIKWFKMMGYDYHIPEEQLVNICNKSTSFIWHELMQNTKPKQEVDNLRNNVIINRLRSTTLNKQDEFSYPIKNIVLYLKKQALEKKINSLQSVIKEKRDMVNNQSKNNKIKYIAIEKLKSQIQENKEREYFLDKKYKMLEKNIQNAEETLTCAKNLTPVELDENPNSTEIMETLQKCAEKLEKILKEIPSHNKHNNSTQKSFRFYSAQKESKTQSTFEKYLIMSERKHSEKITVFKHGRGSAKSNRNNKENASSNRKISKNLFASATEEHANAANKRESLGILPDSYLNKNDLNNELEVDSVENIFMNMYSINESNVNGSLPKNHFDINCTLQFSEHHNLKNVNQMPKEILFDKFYNDEFITNKLQTLLYNHNRQIIWNTFESLNDDLNLDVAKNIILKFRKNERNNNINQEDIARLQFLHIQTELQVLKLKAILKDMLGKIMKKKKFIYAAINSRGILPEQVEDVGKLFELQLYDICLDVTLTEMKKEINSIKKIDTRNDLHITLGKISKTKEDIVDKIGSIKQYISDVYDTLQSTVHAREATIACVRKIGPFVEDLTWSVPLTEHLCSTEVKTFEKFPLEYNRRCVYTNPRVVYRDITDDFPGVADLDSDILYMLTNILENPFSPPEFVVLQILKCKIKLNALKLLPSQSTSNYRKYSIEELQAQESYIQYALDKLNSIIFSSAANNILSTAERTKNVMKIWLEMPLKDFISHKRIVEGHDYKFYEKRYDSFYNGS
ncbi:uncharacterized protein LOC108914847 [Anoplophora glabripennis]|uniref:uncharacterized protein LOC108914847 n=1 Tax=Anoplophora glabripennis TaxID=217634 RepID=UPI0008755D16|nr:uncharacterized protein LOC108914847 [Anoplophora glabripennis]